LQTFLPYPDYIESAKVLDRQRLGKQRVEVVQILDVLHLVTPGARYRNHPVMDMWRGHEPQLCEYGITICEEWKSRGYTDKCQENIEWHLDCATAGEFTMDKPRWFGDMDFHKSHQSNLLRKDREHYMGYFEVPDDLPYVWPKA